MLALRRAMEAWLAKATPRAISSSENGVQVLVVRPGFVHTKMTEGMEPAPFSTTPDKVAADIVAGLDRGATTVWSPGVLRYLFTVMRHLPRPVWRIVSNR